jgi:hypothetical protein
LEAFARRGGGLKLELDIVDGAPEFDALPPVARSVWAGVRDEVRASVLAALVPRLDALIREKYVWLLGDELAQEVLAAGMTTTNGRLMGRAPGYELAPHLDAAHMGVTCLLYLSTPTDPSDGALGLFRPDRSLEVRHATTYYPDKAEGVGSTLVGTIRVQTNLFVAFVNGPGSLHGLARPADSATPWRFVYQCHVVPKGFKKSAIAARLPGPQRARWDALAERG